ncbi:MAG TPA: glutamate--tRNA ligase family protein, partial [Candidatus Paceibacterota bacterium]
ISNTPKHILIYEALEKDIPQYAHLPLLLAPDRSKLSKRTGIVSLNEYKKDYLPEVIFNFLATLSHTYSQEILSKEELIKEFDLKKIHKSGAVFDIKKLNWLNSQYIKRLSPSEFKKVVANEKISDMAVPIITERLEKLSDVKEFDFLWEEAEYPKELLLWKTSSFNDVKMSLMEVLGSFKAKTALNASELRESLDALGKEKGDRGLVYWPLRVALSGREKSPDPIQIAEVLGREEVMERIKTALEKIE